MSKNTVIALIYNCLENSDLICRNFLTSIIQYSSPLKDKIMTFHIFVLQIHTQPLNSRFENNRPLQLQY
jgi:hypothetical protein